MARPAHGGGQHMAVQACMTCTQQWQHVPGFDRRLVLWDIFGWTKSACTLGLPVLRHGQRAKIEGPLCQLQRQAGSTHGPKFSPIVVLHPPNKHAKPLADRAPCSSLQPHATHPRPRDATDGGYAAGRPLGPCPRQAATSTRQRKESCPCVPPPSFSPSTHLSVLPP